MVFLCDNSTEIIYRNVSDLWCNVVEYLDVKLFKAFISVPVTDADTFILDNQ